MPEIHTNNTEYILDAIISFADNAHGSQMRKYTPDRYIVHPVRVMKTCQQYTNDITMLAAALLHDVLEDTPVTAAQITDFLLTLMDVDAARRTVALVHELTDEYIKAKYPGMNRRKRKELEFERLEQTSPDAQTIKYADIMDNCDDIVYDDAAFARKLIREYRALLKKIVKGNSQLYIKAVQVADDCLRKLGDTKTSAPK
ncbi:MAG: HD domain-containing protein [Bacteroidota bacterium]